MTTTETVAILCAFNEWRRGDYEPSEQPGPPDPCKISEAIDAAIAMIERLEAAEKERDAYKSAYADWTAKTEWLQDEINSGKLPAKYLGMHRADGIKVEIDALRTKIAEMEQQEPAWFIDERGEPKRYHKSKADYCKYGGLDLLYPLPGAQGEEK